MNNNNFFYNILLLKNIHTSTAKNYNEKVATSFKTFFMLVMNAFLFIAVKDNTLGFSLGEKFIIIFLGFILIFYVSEKFITYKILSRMLIVPKNHNFNHQSYLTKELFSEMTYTVLTTNSIYDKDIPELEAALINQYMDEILINLESCIAGDSSDNLVGDINKKAIINLLDVICEIIKKLKDKSDFDIKRVQKVQKKISS